jgi:hypothetical protein
MSGVTSFQIKVLTNNDLLPEIAARMKDLSEPFENIIDEWAQSNEDKFRMGQGQQFSGVSQGSGVDWQALSPAYAFQKMKDGFPDWLMRRTGDLQRALTDKELFFRFVGPDIAVFGEPLLEKEFAKVAFNWDSRQTIFLSKKDQKAIEREIYEYFGFGPGYREIKRAAGLAAVRRREETARAEFEFRGAVNE